MPLYEYECDDCGGRFERIQKFSDPMVETCPTCGGVVHKLPSAPAIQFKGTGWYVTDYARKPGDGQGDEKSQGSDEKSQGSDEKSQGSDGKSQGSTDGKGADSTSPSSSSSSDAASKDAKRSSNSKKSSSASSSSSDVSK